MFSVVKGCIHMLKDAHTRRFQFISPFNCFDTRRTFGMAVDTCVTPHTFKFVVGCTEKGTEIYDSATESWERRPSLIPPYGIQGKPSICKSCLYVEHDVYIWSQVDRILHSMKDDVWSVLETPPRREDDIVAEALGAWNGTVFIFMEEGGLSPSLWELLVYQTWRRFARMPSEMHSWLVPPCFQAGNTIRVHASFCQEYVLIHTLVCESGEQGMTNRFVLFNLATKKWEKQQMCAQKTYAKGKDGQWDSSVDRFTEDRQSLRPIYPWKARPY